MVFELPTHSSSHALKERSFPLNCVVQKASKTHRPIFRAIFSKDMYGIPHKPVGKDNRS